MNDTETLRGQCRARFHMHGEADIAELYRDMAEYARHFEVDVDYCGAGAFLDNFEREVAALLGKSAAVFMPSGVMAQQIALRIYAERSGSKQIVYHPTCHLETHEQRGYHYLHGLEARIVGEAHRLLEVDDFKAMRGPAAALVLELPQRWCGGLLPQWGQLLELIEAGREHIRYVHLDGARLWECLPFYSRAEGMQLADITRPFDSVYVSFYKTLGGMSGAMLAGDAEFIRESRVWLRRQGGNLCRMHPFVIAARMGMERHLPHIPAYVQRARAVASLIGEMPGLRCYPPAPMVNMFHVHIERDAAALYAARDACARDKRLWVTGRFYPSYLPQLAGRACFMEAHVGEALLNIGDDEIVACFERLAG